MRKLMILSVVLCLAVMTGCATVKPTPPAGCEKSVIWAYSPWSQVVLKTMVDSIHILAGTQHGPASYAIIKDSAQKLVTLLEGGNVTYSQVQSMPDISGMIVSTLGLIFAPGQMLDACDREILVAYLKMI